MPPAACRTSAFTPRTTAAIPDGQAGCRTSRGCDSEESEKEPAVSVDVNTGKSAAGPVSDASERDLGQAGQAALAIRLGARLGPAATFATTEHFNLQTARSLT